MNTKVLITIKGIQHEFEDIFDTGIQTIQPGIYKQVLDKHIITYEELSEKTDGGSPFSVKNILKISPDSVSLTKHGQISTDMFFKEGYHHSGVYETSFGTLQAGFITSKLSIVEKADSIDIQIDYSLELNYNHISDCTVFINIHSL